VHGLAERHIDPPSAGAAAHRVPEQKQKEYMRESKCRTPDPGRSTTITADLIHHHFASPFTVELSGAKDNRLSAFLQRSGAVPTATMTMKAELKATATANPCAFRDYPIF
jgi:hypothetical protein